MYTLTVNAAGISDQYGYPGTGELLHHLVDGYHAPNSHVINALGTSQTADSFPVSVTFSDPAGSGGARPRASRR